MPWRISLCAAALLTLGALLSGAEPPWALGDRLAGERRFEAAAAAYACAALGGDARALARLAELRRAGRGVREDRAAAEAEMRAAAASGAPEAQRIMARLVWPLSLGDCLMYIERREKDPAERDTPEALAALDWERRAALGWLAEGRPYAAWCVVAALEQVGINRYQVVHGTAAVAAELRAALAAVPSDRPAALAALLALRPPGPGTTKDEAVRTERAAQVLLQRLLLPPAAPLGWDVGQAANDSDEAPPLQQVAVLGEPGGPGVVVLRRRGQFGMCGTGRRAGGVTAPPEVAVPSVDLVLAFDAAGLPTLRHERGRESMCLIDADGDGEASELVIHDEGRDYGRRPFLRIVDLAMAPPTVMAAEAFAPEAEPDVEVVTEQTIAERDKPPAITGSWLFAPRADGRRDLLLRWVDHGVAGERRLVFAADQLRWREPRGGDLRCWQPVQ